MRGAILAAWMMAMAPLASPASAQLASTEAGLVMVGEMKAKPGMGAALFERMRKEVPPIPQTAGLRAFEVLRDPNDSDRIVIVEIWDSAADHERSVKNIKPESIREVKALVQSMKGERFTR